MSFKAQALLAAFMFTTAPVAVPAAAQQAAAPAPAKGVPPSKEARNAIVALQKAANENRMADIPGLVQGVLAVAKPRTTVISPTSCS